MWQFGRDRTMDEFVPQFRQLAAETHGPDEVDALVNQLQTVVPQTLHELQNDLRLFNQVDGSFDAVSPDSVTDIPRLKPNITETFELGYKAVIANKLLVTADVYQNKKTEFVGQFEVETPNVFLNAASLSDSLTQYMAPALEHDDPELRAVLNKLDAVARGGNNNGTPVDELTRLFVSGSNNNGTAYIPFGTVSPEEATDPTAVILTYRNLGEVTLYGLNLGFTYYASDAWTVGFNYSHLSQNTFPERAVNAPMDKFNLGSRYHHAETGLSIGGWIRYRGSFPMASGVYAGDVAAYTMVDLNAAYDLPIHSHDASATLSLNVSNLFDRKHQEFIGAPEIGRMISGGLTVRF